MSNTRMPNYIDQKENQKKIILIWCGVFAALLLAAGIAVIVMILIHNSRESSYEDDFTGSRETSAGIPENQDEEKTKPAAKTETRTAPDKATAKNKPVQTAKPQSAANKKTSKESAPKPKTPAPIRNAAQPYHFLWQDFDAEKLKKTGDSWTSFIPVIPKGKIIKKAIVSYEVPGLLDKTDDKEIALESVSLKITGVSMGGEEHAFFDYDVKIQKDGALQITVRQTAAKDNDKSWLEWKILNDGTEIPLVFELGKARIRPPKSKIEVKFYKAKVIAVYNLDTVPELKDPAVQKAIKKVTAVFMQGTTQIAKLPMSFTDKINETSPGHDHLHGVFPESAAVIQNRRKIDFYNFLKKLQKAGKINLHQINTLDLSHRDLGVDKEELKQFAALPDDFREWKMWGQPVDKIKKILKLFDLNVNMTNIKDFSVPDPGLAKKERRELAAKLKTADRVEIYSDGKLLMLVVGKGQVK